MLIMAFCLSGCGASAVQIIPTERPTITPTPTATQSRSQSGSATPTVTPSPARTRAPGEPSPTPLFGATRTPAPGEVSASLIVTPTPNPNAPRIEFFTSDKTAVAPGERLTLFWSTRGGGDVRIYQLGRGGERNRVWNVAASGRQDVQTSSGDRGQLDFLLIVGQAELQSEQRLSVALQCPLPWFFAPAPTTCPDDLAQQVTIVEQSFERGRMIYLSGEDVVYALFNDGFDPAWVVFENRYRPGVDPESAENFIPPPGYFQPLAQLGFVWRGNDTVRNRLGLGIQAEVAFESLVQREGDNFYISSTNGTIVQLLPNGESWQIISPQPVDPAILTLAATVGGLPQPTTTGLPGLPPTPVSTPSPAAQPPPLASSTPEGEGSGQ
ncbi:MAG: hypothetical protein SF029_02695 [bacterium]|nr:hypothetical protein [bacterium]